ncbi:hypothetical protein OH818_01725 [Jiella pelagia]|uniref:Uncharacterized protein n=1 Tax=Jiella pelagia TaxID=2986949 RepID=A0ABY7C1I0_9HYPH|nr:hypothetical protein OH818_01725 [Jiella pelagia]
MAQITEETRRFRALLSLCGLTHAEAAELLERGHETIRQKASGHKDVTGRDLRVIADLWLRIDACDDGLTGRPADHARAIEWARRASETGATEGDE